MAWRKRYRQEICWHRWNQSQFDPPYGDRNVISMMAISAQFREGKGSTLIISYLKNPKIIPARNLTQDLPICAANPYQPYYSQHKDTGKHTTLWIQSPYVVIEFSHWLKFYFLLVNKLFQSAVVSHKGSMPGTTQKTHKSNGQNSGGRKVLKSRGKGTRREAS